MTNEEIMIVAKDYSMTSGTNIMNTILCSQRVDRDHIAGDIVECGVWKGGHIIASMLASVTPRRYWLFDTFDGMTEPGPEDSRKGHHATASTKYRKGGAKNWCRAELPEVKSNIEKFARLEQEIIYVQGPVESTLKTHELPDSIALLRLDTDFYSSTAVELEVLWPRVVLGGAMIIDDYNSWSGCKQAVDQYFGQNFSYTPIDQKSIMVVKQ